MKFEIRIFPPPFSIAETESRHRGLSWKSCHVLEKTEQILSKQLSAFQLFLSRLPCAVWPAETLMSVFKITKVISWKYKISIILLLAEKRSIFIEFHHHEFYRENLVNRRVRIIEYLRQSMDVTNRSIARRSNSHPRRPSSHNRITSLWRWSADLQNQVLFYEKSMLLNFCLFHPIY